MAPAPGPRQSVGPKSLFNPTFINRERDTQSLIPKRPSRRASAKPPPPPPSLDLPANSSSEEEEDESEVDSDDQDFIGYQSFLKDARLNDPKSAPHPSTVRISGGRAAVTKRINIEMDSDDEIIKTMKDQRYRDQDIQKRLVSEGRTKYAEKSITTRYNRITRALNENETKTLDEELTDWHEGDDDVLDKAREKYRDQLEKATERATSHFWLNVSKEVHQLQAEKGEPKKRFSRNACRDRWTAREAGTALPALELDPDQEGRMAAYNKRKAEVDAAKAATEEQRQAKDDEALRKYYEEMDVEKEKRHKHLTKKEMKEINDAIRIKKDAERAERARIKNEAAAKRKAERAERAEAKKIADAQKVDSRRTRAQALENKREDAKLERARDKMELELKQLERLRSEVEDRFQKQQDRRNVTSIIRRVMHTKLDEQDKASGLIGVKRARLGANVVKEDSAVIIQHLRNPHATPYTTKRIKSEDGLGSQQSSPVGGMVHTGNIRDRSFMNDPRANPRGFMTLAELQAVCSMRGVALTSTHKRKLVQALMTKDNQEKSRELQAMLRARSLPLYGDKATLIWRLSNDDAGKLAKGSDMHAQIKQRAQEMGISEDASSSPVANIDPALLAGQEAGADGSGAATAEAADAEAGAEGDDEEGAESESGESNEQFEPLGSASSDEEPLTKKAKQG